MNEPDPPPSPATAQDAPAPNPPPAAQAYCANCGAPLYGKYCYACGQPIQGLVRHFSSVLSDVADSLFNIDERLFRTLLPLYFRPGRLTLEYFAGRRARYVTPFRLVFFLAIITFFVLQVTVRSNQPHTESFAITTGNGISVTKKPGGKPAAPPPEDGAFDHGNITMNDRVIWNRQTHPLRIDWLPYAANDWLNDLIGHAQANMHALKSGTEAQKKAALQRMVQGMFSAAPTVLFVLLPVFALLLKIFYIFKRRLYMEHLIVAMHSHAFLMLSILVLVILDLLAAHVAWLGTPTGVLRAAVWIWLFVYLFLMQKRVYRQGWFMTTVKFAIVGVCYSLLLLFAMAAAALIGLAS
ncbi:MAG TPA: DUF3667 domain-containing protein [Rhodanobacteraceae bacterium]|nr:DUF3667 domain-containing protein [Rhodanobacteraceae bacterium]